MSFYPPAPGGGGQHPPYPPPQGQPYSSAPYPTGGGAPYPSGGGAPYPSGGGMPYPSGGGAPYPTSGSTPHPSAVPPTGPARLVTKVELHISCQGLMNKDVMSKSDPIVILQMHDAKARKWHEIGRTEQIKNTLDPQFSKAILIEYYFEEVQKLKILVHDIDSESGSLSSADFLGGLECTLAQIVSARTFTKALGHPSGSPAGKITIRSEEVSKNNDIVSLSFRGEKLDKKDFLGKSDPFLTFSRVNEDGSFVVVHKTEIQYNTLNPTWQPFTVTAQSLCNGDYKRTIKIDCYDWDSDGSHDLIGSFTTNLEDMLQATQRQVTYSCINPKKQQKKKGYVNSGVIHLSNARLTKRSSFLDYIGSGLQINFTVAIDFTASNGDPNHPASLHYINPYQPNEYTKALMAVGEVCQEYDTDKMFPALGFGAQIPPDFRILRMTNGLVTVVGPYDRPLALLFYCFANLKTIDEGINVELVDHEFPLNFNLENPYCAGLQGILDAYQAAVRQVRLYGPTNFSPVINHVARFASQASQTANVSANNYYVLLIVTDGEITDMDQTVHAIVHAASLPMSIIIVGVGSADFTNMELLDADKRKLSSGGKTAARDIVQFVPFRDFQTQHPSALAKAVLAEVPNQVTEYYSMKGIPAKTA